MNIFIPVFMIISLSLFASPLHADVIKIPIGEQNSDSNLQLPQRGMLREAVIKNFGKPLKEYPAIGNPPITRWSYDGFDVYFEYNHVINSVKHFTPKNNHSGDDK